MARARNIKPGFFKNEDLAECTPWARLCFAGLWTLADREGRLEDRPKRIKGELFPFDSVEVEPLLAELVQWGFIVRYQVGGSRFIQIAKFVEHQAPHGTEKDGLIPDANGFLTVHERGRNGYVTGTPRLEPYVLTVLPPMSDGIDNSSLTVKGGVSDGGHNTLIPDSLIPDSLIPEITPLPPEGGRRRSRKVGDEPAGFVEFWAAYPRKVGKDAAIKAFGKRQPDGELLAVMLAALAAQAKSEQWQRDGGQYVPHPSTWLNEGRWKDEAADDGVAATPRLAADHPLMIQAAALPTDWWRLAGFDTPGDASNARCYWTNFAEFRDGKRIEQAHEATA